MRCELGLRKGNEQPVYVAVRITAPPTLYLCIHVLYNREVRAGPEWTRSGHLWRGGRRPYCGPGTCWRCSDTCRRRRVAPASPVGPTGSRVVSRHWTACRQSLAGRRTTTAESWYPATQPDRQTDTPRVIITDRLHSTWLRLPAFDRHRPPITAIGWCLDVCHKKNTNASRRQEFSGRWTVSLELSACYITWQRHLTCTV